jgi:uncharacterized protein (DUF58 family)
VVSKEILKKVKKIEIKTKGIVNNLFGGEYQSAFKGAGMVFSEVRAYQFGDDIRQIDWNVTARSDEPFIKIYEEEREQTVMLCVDISPSGLFGSFHQRKMELSIELCAVLAFSAIQNGDKVGLILFTDQIEKVIMPKKGRTHVLRIIRELLTAEPKGKGTNIGQALSYANRILHRRSILFLATDHQSTDYDRALKITNQKHDLVNIHIQDHLESELPDLGLITVKDAETGVIETVDSSNKQLRKAYAERVEKRRQNLAEKFKKNRIDTLNVHTNDSYVEPLSNFLKRRISRY